MTMNINDIIKQCTLNHHRCPDSFSGYIHFVDKYEPLTLSKNEQQLPKPAQILAVFNNYSKKSI